VHLDLHLVRHYVLFQIRALTFERILLNFEMAQVLVLPKVNFKFRNKLSAINRKSECFQVRKVTYVTKDLLHFSLQSLIISPIQHVIEFFKFISLRVGQWLYTAHGCRMVPHSLNIVQTLNQLNEISISLVVDYFDLAQILFDGRINQSLLVPRILFTLETVEVFPRFLWLILHGNLI